jgi:D-glycero-D-manno-heptose 1,7-bisphosphate phosphatase
MKLLILDRDGVINIDSDDYIKTYQEWQPLPGSLQAIARATKAGFTITVATNQSGVGRGLFSLIELANIHARMIEAVEDEGGRIEMIAFCPHTPEDKCECRKPKPGLLKRISKELGVGLDGVPYIGDSKRDMDAARAVNARPVLVRTGYGSQELEKYPELAELETHADLAAAIDALVLELHD